MRVVGDGLEGVAAAASLAAWARTRTLRLLAVEL